MAAWQLRAMLQVWVGVGGMCALRVQSCVRDSPSAAHANVGGVAGHQSLRPGVSLSVHVSPTSPTPVDGVCPVQAGQRGGNSADGNYPVIKDTATAPAALKYAVRAHGQQYLACTC